MTAITKGFKNTYIRIGDSIHSRKVQEAMFKLGFKWVFGERYVSEYPNYGGYIYVDHNCRMWYSRSDDQRCTRSFVHNGETYVYADYTEKTLEQYETAVAMHKTYKKYAKKARRKRQKLRKQGYTTSRLAFGECPVDKHAAVIYVRRNGEAGFSPRAYMLDWTEQGGLSIMAYKIGEYTPSKGKVISVDEMVGKVAKDLGKEVVKLDNHWTLHDPAKDPAPNPEDVEEVLLRNGETRERVFSYGTSPMPEYQVVAYRLKNKPKDSVGDGVKVADTNPKKQYGVQSIPLHYWSTLASAYGSLALYNGALKYGKANFANTPVEAGIYIDGAMRHLAAWVAGEEFDPADNVPNLGGVLANIAILLEARAAGMLIDDRPKLAGYLKERDQLKEVVKHLNKLHEGKTPKHYVQGEE